MAYDEKTPAFNRITISPADQTCGDFSYMGQANASAQMNHDDFRIDRGLAPTPAPVPLDTRHQPAPDAISGAWREGHPPKPKR